MMPKIITPFRTAVAATTPSILLVAFLLIPLIIITIILSSSTAVHAEDAAQQQQQQEQQPQQLPRGGVVRFNLFTAKNADSDKCHLDLSHEAVVALRQADDGEAGGSSSNNKNKNNNNAPPLRVVVGHGRSSGKVGVTHTLQRIARIVAQDYKLPDKQRQNDVLSFIKPYRSNNKEKEEKTGKSSSIFSSNVGAHLNTPEETRKARQQAQLADFGSAVLLLGSSGFISDTDRNNKEITNTLLVDFSGLEAVSPGGDNDDDVDGAFSSSSSSSSATTKVSEGCLMRALSVISSLKNVLVIHVDNGFDKDTIRRLEIPARLSEVFRLALTDPEASKLIAHATTSTNVDNTGGDLSSAEEAVFAAMAQQRRAGSPAIDRSGSGSVSPDGSGGGADNKDRRSLQEQDADAKDQYDADQELLEQIGRPAGGLLIVVNKVDQCDAPFHIELPMTLVGRGRSSSTSSKNSDDSDACDKLGGGGGGEQQRKFCLATRGIKQFFESRVSAVRMTHESICRNELLLDPKRLRAFETRVLELVEQTFAPPSTKTASTKKSAKEAVTIIHKLCDKMNAGVFPSVPELWSAWDENLLKTVLDFAVRSFLRDVEAFFYRPPQEIRSALPFATALVKKEEAGAEDEDDDKCNGDDNENNNCSQDKGVVAATGTTGTTGTTTAGGTSVRRRRRIVTHLKSIVPPHTLEEFETFRTKAGEEALARAKQLLLGVLRPDLFKTMSQQLTVETSRKFKELQRTTTRYIMDFADACVNEAETAQEVAVLPVRNAVFNAWLDKYTNGCKHAFVEQLSRFETLIGPESFANRKKNLFTQLQRVVDAIQKRNTDALFARAENWLRISVGECAEQFERSDSMKIIPAAELRRHCEAAYPQFEGIVRNNAAKDGSEWIISEPAFPDMLASAKVILSRKCDTAIESNAIRVTQAIDALANQVQGQYDRALRNIALPMHKRELQQQMERLGEEYGVVFGEHTNNFADHEKAAAVRKLQDAFKVKRDHLRQKNIDEWAQIVEPVKTCAMKNLQAVLKARSLTDAISWFETLLQREFERHVAECFALHRQGKLGFQRKEFPLNLMRDVQDTWMQEREYRIYADAIARKWNIGMIFALLGVGMYVYRRFFSRVR